MKNVEIYTSPTCHFCQELKSYLKENSITYTDVNIAGDEEKTKELVEKSGQIGVPVVFISSEEDMSNPEMIIGFNREKLAAALGIE